MELQEFINGVKADIGRSDVEEALRKIIAFADHTPRYGKYSNVARKIQAIYMKTKRAEVMQTLGADEADQRYNKVNDQMLMLLDDMQRGVHPPSYRKRSGLLLLIIAVIGTLSIWVVPNYVLDDDPGFTSDTAYHVLILPFQSYTHSNSDQGAPNNLALIELFDSLRVTDKLNIEIQVGNKQMGYVTYDKAAAIGRKYGAHLVIWGSYDRPEIHDSLRVNLRYVSLETEGMPFLFRQGESGRKTIRFASDIREGSMIGNLREVVLFSAALIEEKLGKIQHALNTLEKLKVAHDPNYSIVFYYLGSYHFHLGKYEQALHYLDTAIVLNPQQPDYYATRGDVYYEMWLLDNAWSDYLQAIQLNAKNFYAHIGIGKIYSDSLQLEPALEYFTRAIDIAAANDHPGIFFAYNGRGWAHYLMGEYDNALADFAEAIRTYTPVSLYYNFPFPYNGRGWTYFDLGELDQAITNFLLASEMNPQFFDYQFGVCIAQVEKGEFPQALVNCRKAYALDSTRADINQILGRLMLDQDSIDQAEPLLIRAVQLDSANAFNWHNLGRLYVSKSAYRKALACFDQAVELKPDFAFSYLERSKVYAALGEKDKESDDLKKFDEMQ